MGQSSEFRISTTQPPYLGGGELSGGENTPLNRKGTFVPRDQGQ